LRGGEGPTQTCLGASAERKEKITKRRHKDEQKKNKEKERRGIFQRIEWKGSKGRSEREGRGEEHARRRTVWRR
jgi:hypothetical protein